MASRSIGLDIGTHAVRAVEISLGRGLPVVRRFGQVTLPYGAVVAGEVVDPPAVAAALRRLWKSVGFSSRSVVVGVGNARVVARTTEVPAMPDAELRSALRYSAPDLIPIPVDEAVLDHQVLEENVVDGQPTMRVLFVAAQRDMLASLLAALEGAGLTASRVDLIPFALIRALHVDDFGLSSPETADHTSPAEAIVGVGAGVTNVVVHESGLPRFVRTLATGGNAAAEAVAAELAIDIDSAEGLTRGADPRSDDAAVARAAHVASASLAPVVDETRGSLDFYLASSEVDALRTVTLTGGGSRSPELAERLRSVLAAPVESGRPLRLVEVGSTGFGPDVLGDNADLFTVALGLALGGEALPGPSRRITLLPAEIGTRQRERRQLVGAGVGVAALAGVLGAVLQLRAGQVANAQDQADDADARTVALQTEVQALADVEALQADIATRRQTVIGVLERDVAWTRTLQEMATVMPSDVWLTSFTGTAGTADALAPGTVTVAGMGFDQASAARWLERIGELDSLAGLWLPSSTKSGEAGQELITFSSNANLTPAAGSDRAARFVDQVTG